MRLVLATLFLVACGDNIKPVEDDLHGEVVDIDDRLPDEQPDAGPVKCEPGVPQEYCPDAGVEVPCEHDDLSCHWHGNHWHCDKSGHEHNGKWHQGHL